MEAPQLQFLINSLAFSRIVFQTRVCPSVKLLAVASVAFGRQAAWRPGAYWRSWVYVQCSRTTYPLSSVQDKLQHTFTSFSVVARLARHNVVASIPAAPLVTDTRRSAVGSGTREDVMTMPNEMRVHDAFSVRDLQRARHVRGDPGWCRTWSMMWTSTAMVNECASVKMLGGGSCSTWSSSCLAAGCIPRRPPTSRILGLTPFRTLSPLEDFLRRFKTCKTHLQLSELSGSRV